MLILFQKYYISASPEEVKQTKYGYIRFVDHRTQIKMKLTDVKADTYIGFDIESNVKNPKFNVLLI